jgi:hypothetical protein
VLTDGAGRLSAAACGGGRRYLPLELLLRCDGRREQASTTRGGSVGWVKLLRCYGKCWPAANGRRRGGAPRWAHRQPSAACRGTAGCSPYSGRLLLFASKQGPFIYLVLQRPSSTRARRYWRQTARRAAAVRSSTRSHASGSRSQATSVKGNQLLVPRGGGAWPARTLRRRDSQRGVGTPGRLPALWWRSRARPIRFSAGQYYFDRT